MNLDQIASRIALPDSCLGSEIPALKTLTEKYPFAQVFSILYLKALSSQNDIGFDEALQKHAYRVTDRMKLYDLIHSVSQEEVTDADVIDSVAIDDVLIVADVPEPTENTSPAAIIESTEMVSQPEMDDLGFHLNDDLGRDAINRVSTENESNENEPNENQPIANEAVIEPEIIESNEEITINNFTPDFIQDEVELEIISQVVATVYNDNLEHSTPEKPVEEKKSAPLTTSASEVEEGLIEGKRSFSSWLKAGNQTESTADNKPAEKIQEEVKIIEKQIDKIIDKFIEKEPTISRPKKEFYSPTKKAKESVSSAGLIYTETLADIFAIQGNFPKAITAYEQLMLTNPEKKIFFAQRIKELKEKLNT